MNDRKDTTDLRAELNRLMQDHGAEALKQAVAEVQQPEKLVIELPEVSWNELRGVLGSQVNTTLQREEIQLAYTIYILKANAQ